MRTAISVVASLLVLVSTATASENLLPDFTGEWANGGPYTVSGIREKAVLIFMVERG